MDPMEAWKQKDARTLARARAQFVSGVIYLVVAVGCAFSVLFGTSVFRFGPFAIIPLIALVVCVRIGIGRMIHGGFDYVVQRLRS